MARLFRITIGGYPLPLRMLTVFGLLWLGVLALPVESPDLVGLYAICYVFVVAASAGNSLRAMLSSPRARTVPGYRAPHIVVALGLCAVALTVSSGVAAFRGLPPAGWLAACWSCTLLALIGGYAGPGFVRSHPRLGLVAAVLGSGTLALAGQGPLIRVTGSMGWGSLLLLLIANACITILLARRMFDLNEEAFEYLRVDPREITQSIYEKNPGPVIPSLDSIQTAAHIGLRPSLRQRLRHLELGLLPARPSFLRLVGALAAVFLVLRFFGQKTTGPFLLSWAIAFPVMSLLFAGHNVRRFLMLPLPRRELVAQGGAAILLAGLRMWCAAALATALSNWSVPPVDLLLLALVLQLPLFGLLMLAMSMHTPWTSLKVLLLIPAVVALAWVGVWAAAAPIQIPIALCLIGGAGLIALSYHRWCNAELI